MVITADPPVPARNRMMIKPGIFCAKLHPNRNKLNIQHEITITGHLPNISLDGARNRGPNEYPSKKMVIMKEPTAWEGSWRSRRVRLTPGANIEEPRGLMNVITLMRIMFVLRFRAGQYLDFGHVRERPNTTLMRSDY